MAGGFGVGAVEFGHLNFAGEAELGQDPDAVEVGIDLVPPEAMAHGDGMGMMVVVPALAAGEQSYPETVARVIVGFKAAAAPHVGCRVDQPCGVQAQGDAQQSAPKDHGNAVDPAAPDPSAGEKQRGAER